MPIVTPVVNLEPRILRKFADADFVYVKSMPESLCAHLGVSGRYRDQMFTTLNRLVSEAYITRTIQRGEAVFGSRGQRYTRSRRVTYRITVLGLERLQEIRAAA